MLTGVLYLMPTDSDTNKTRLTGWTCLGFCALALLLADQQELTQWFSKTYNHYQSHYSFFEHYEIVLLNIF